MVKKRRRNTKKTIESFAVCTTSQVSSHDQEHNELSAERVPREIMCARSDRAELPHHDRAELPHSDRAKLVHRNRAELPHSDQAELLHIDRADLPAFVSRIETVDELNSIYNESSTERESREIRIERSDHAERPIFISRIGTLVEPDDPYTSEV